MKLAAENFWRHVKKTENCWLWEGGVGNTGYGLFKCPVRKSCVLAHRFSYELTFGIIPDGNIVHHTCGNRLCVRPEHLLAMRRESHMSYHPRRRPTHCPYGHPYSGENIYIDRRGLLNCRLCRNNQVRKYRRKKRSEVEALRVQLKVRSLERSTL